MTSDPSAALEEIRERRRFFDELGEEASAKMMAWALGQSAADVFPLLAAIDAVLKEADDFEANRPERLVPRSYASECFRAAVIRELTGKGGSDGDE